MRALLLLLALVACGDGPPVRVDAVVDIHAWTNCRWNSGQQTCEIACADEPTYEPFACVARDDQRNPGLMMDMTFVYEGHRGGCWPSTSNVIVFNECE
jgi:hypothetical protein